MPSRLGAFEAIVRRAFQFTEPAAAANVSGHPFEARNIHGDLQATFEAFKFVDEEVQRISGAPDFGTSMMERVFGGVPPIVALNPGMTKSEKSEQQGYKMLFAGSILGIRNPRGHKSGMVDDPDACLDHLALASMLLRRLDDAGLR